MINVIPIRSFARTAPQQLMARPRRYRGDTPDVTLPAGILDAQHHDRRGGAASHRRAAASRALSNSFVNGRKEFRRDRTSRQICPLVPPGTECSTLEKPRSCRRSDFSRRKLLRMIVGWFGDEAESKSFHRAVGSHWIN